MFFKCTIKQLLMTRKHSFDHVVDLQESEDEKPAPKAKEGTKKAEKDSSSDDSGSEESESEDEKETPKKKVRAMLPAYYLIVYFFYLLFADGKLLPLMKTEL